MKGLHIIADLYRCARSASQPELLVSADLLRELCVGACSSAGLTVLGQHFYQFDGLEAGQVGGATGAVVLAESHLAIHTWPERDAATLDVYVCNHTADNSDKAEQLYQQLLAALKPADVLVERVWRGRELPLPAKLAA